MDLSDSGMGQVVGPGEHGNELSGLMLVSPCIIIQFK